MTTVATVTSVQEQAVKNAKLPRTLMGDTKAMRAAGTTYLPKEPAESQPAYDNRRNRSTLFNAFSKTVSDMTGKVFTKAVMLSKEVPQQLQDFAENIDLAGRHLNVFARDVFFDGLQVGGNYILVDMPPKMENADGSPVTLAQEQAAKIRPYLIHITVERVLGWKADTIGGVTTLTQIRFKECVSEPDGEFGEKEVEQIRVIDAGVNGGNATWRTFRKSTTPKPTDEWELYRSGSTTLAKITLVPFYTNRTGFMTFSPPLEKLADLNVAHWQSQSDQRNILHVARVPILFGAGFDADATLAVGASEMVRSSAPDAKLTYVEHSGAAISAGDKDLENIERQMEAMGLQLLVGKPGGQSATGEIRDDSKENSPLAMMADALGDALEQALGFMAEYIGLGINGDNGGSVTVNKDFGVSSMRGDLQQLIAARANGDISRETLWEEMQRRDYLGPTFDGDVEKERIASEPPPLNGPPMDLGGNNSNGPAA